MTIHAAEVSCKTEIHFCDKDGWTTPFRSLILINCREALLTFFSSTSGCCISKDQGKSWSTWYPFLKEWCKTLKEAEQKMLWVEGQVKDGAWERLLSSCSTERAIIQSLHDNTYCPYPLWISITFIYSFIPLTYSHFQLILVHARQNARHQHMQYVLYRPLRGLW